MTQFKVGDRVAVYDGCNKGTGSVMDADETSVHVAGDYNFPNQLRGRWFHPKQCRKLVKKKRREIWVREVNDEMCSGSTQLMAVEQMPPNHPKWTRFIKAPKGKSE